MAPPSNNLPSDVCQTLVSLNAAPEMGQVVVSSERLLLGHSLATFGLCRNLKPFLYAHIVSATHISLALSYITYLSRIQNRLYLLQQASLILFQSRICLHRLLNQQLDIA